MNTKKLLTFLVTITFIILGYGVAIPLGEYLRETKDVSLVYISLLFSTYSLGQLISAPILGRVGDIVGKKRIMLCSIVIYIISFVMSINVSNEELILFFRFLTGMFAGATILNIESYIGEHSPEHKRVLYFTLTSLAIALGMVLGPIIGIVIIKYKLFISIFWLFIAFLIVFLLNKYLYEIKQENLEKTFIKDFIKSAIEELKNPKNVYIFLGFFMLGIVSSSLEAIGVAFVIDNYELKTLNIAFNLILVIIAVVYVLFINPVINAYFNKYKYSMIMILLSVVGLLIMAFSININILVLGFLLLIVGLSSVISIMSTLITLHSQKNGMLFGMRNATMGIGAITGPIFSATLYSINSRLFLLCLSFIGLLVIFYAYKIKLYK